MSTSILNHHTTLKYEKRQFTVEHSERLAEYNSMKFHPRWSQPCEICGKTFVGGDWRLAYTPFCSEKCELAAYKKIEPIRRYEIKLFWRDFGKDIHLLEEWQP